MHDIAEEIITWIVVGIYILGFIAKVYKDNRKPKRGRADVPPRVVRRDNPPRAVTPVAEQSVVKPAAAMPVYDFTAESEGTSSVEPVAPMKANAAPRLSRRQRALRNTIVMGEILQPKFRRP